MNQILLFLLKNVIGLDFYSPNFRPKITTFWRFYAFFGHKIIYTAITAAIQCFLMAECKQKNISEIIYKNSKLKSYGLATVILKSDLESRAFKKQHIIALECMSNRTSSNANGIGQMALTI